jgi:RecT family
MVEAGAVMSTTDLARVGGDSVMVTNDTLVYLGLDPRKPEVRALVALCQRYRLDPLLNHAQVIPAKGGNKAYITRDGMIEIAHRSGQLDGIVVDEQHQTEAGGHSATVSVWRKDMSHPFTYKGGCGHDEPQSKQGNGAEMAIARAERRALRRAFSIPAYGDDEPYEDIETPPPAAAAAPIRRAAPGGGNTANPPPGPTPIQAGAETTTPFVRHIWMAAESRGLDNDALDRLSEDTVGKTAAEACLDVALANQLLTAIKAQPAPPAEGAPRVYRPGEEPFT